VVGASQESVAVPLVGGGGGGGGGIGDGLGAGGLVVAAAVVEGSVVDALIGTWPQPASTHATSTKTPVNFIFKSTNPHSWPMQRGHQLSCLNGAASGGQADRRAADGLGTARCVPTSIISDISMGYV